MTVGSGAHIQVSNHSQDQRACTSEVLKESESVHFGCVQHLCACSTFFGPSARLAQPALHWTGQNVAFFPSPAANVFLSPLSWRSSRGIVSAVQGRRPPTVCVWASWGHCVKPRRPGFRFHLPNPLQTEEHLDGRPSDRFSLHHGFSPGGVGR